MNIRAVNAITGFIYLFLVFGFGGSSVQNMDKIYQPYAITLLFQMSGVSLFWVIREIINEEEEIKPVVFLAKMIFYSVLGILYGFGYYLFKFIQYSFMPTIKK